MIIVFSVMLLAGAVFSWRWYYKNIEPDTQTQTARLSATAIESPPPTVTKPAPAPVAAKPAPTPGVLSCRKCGCESIDSGKAGFGAGKAIGGALLLGPVGLLGGLAGKNKITLTCLNCGHKWKPGKR